MSVQKKNMFKELVENMTSLSEALETLALNLKLTDMSLVEAQNASRNLDKSLQKMQFKVNEAENKSEVMLKKTKQSLRLVKSGNQLLN